jgi:hypothetical protein
MFAPMHLKKKSPMAKFIAKGTSVSDGLAALSRLFSQKGGRWTQRSYARAAYADKSGYLACDVTDPNACQFCLFGGVYLVSRNDKQERALERLLDKAAAKLDNSGFSTSCGSGIGFNDYSAASVLDIRKLLRTAKSMLPRKSA